MLRLRGQRSVHNNYFTLPVLFIMISNHYPITFGQSHAGFVPIRSRCSRRGSGIFNLRHTGRTVWATRDRRARDLALAVAIAPAPDASGRSVFRCARIAAVLRLASGESDPARFTVAPKGLMLVTSAQIVANAQKINEQAAATRAMPIGNLTQMTDAERAVLAAWIAARREVGARER